MSKEENSNNKEEQDAEGESEDGQVSIHKIQRTGRAGMSYMVTLPKEMVKELDWRERQKVEIRKDGEKLIITDWQPE